MANLTVKFKPYSWYDSENAIHNVLIESRVDVFTPGYYVNKLSKGLYKINLPVPPSNWREILNQYGKVIQ